MPNEMSDARSLFDRGLVQQHRERAAKDFDSYDFLFREVAERLADRLDDVLRDFPDVLDLGCHAGHLARHVQKRRGVQQVVACDLSPAMVARAAAQDDKSRFLVADEEGLPFGERRFDLVLSCLNLHWTNDLPGALIQIRRCLKPGGLFLGAMFGGETLKELYQAFLVSESEGGGGISPRISPFTEVRDAGQLLQRAGFIEPVSDSDTLTVTYPNSRRLLTDLRGMGETNALHARRRNFTPRGTLARMTKLYEDRFRNEEGRLPATFQIVYLTGWIANTPKDVT
ncbi:MAG: SAM-dependent methyltransferase [Rhodospirillaceae bacterium]|nr:MAG: SAM-dependent methyltransferase [Rhodospirillaceae bacterium]